MPAKQRGLRSTAATFAIVAAWSGFLGVAAATAAAEQFRADDWLTECDGRSGCSVMVPFHPLGSGGGAGSYALAFALDGGLVTIVGTPPPISAAVQVDRNLPFHCSGAPCLFSPGDSARLAGQLAGGSMVLVEVKSGRGRFHASVGAKGYQAGIAKLRAWSYPTRARQ